MTRLAAVLAFPLFPVYLWLPEPRVLGRMTKQKACAACDSARNAADTVTIAVNITNVRFLEFAGVVYRLAIGTTQNILSLHVTKQLVFLC